MLFLLIEVWLIWRASMGGAVDHLQSTSGLQVGEELDDVLGHRWGSRQMVTGGLESVLISDPVDGDDDAIGRGVGVRSAGDGADILGFRSNLLLGSGFLDLGAILGFEANYHDVKMSVTNQIEFSLQLVIYLNL